MKRLGVIGYPLGHTLSPVIHQAALQAVGFDARYEAWETPPERLPKRIASLRARDCLGANVTVPYKEAVLHIIDDIDGLARQVGAVNTIVQQRGRLSGHNTDVPGFQRALREDAGFAVSGRDVLLMGAGGAARAVIIALIQEGAASVSVSNRTMERAQRLVSDLLPLAGKTALAVAPFATLADAVPNASLLVNCTSVGMYGSGTEGEVPLPLEKLTAEALVVDIVYRPRETALLKAARSRGARTMGGLPMLVYQGAASFELWTGQPAPIDVMFEAAESALSSQDQGGDN